MKFKFEKLRIWQESMEYGEKLNQIAVDFPKLEMYNLSSQLRRAGDSIALNISEGSIAQSNPEQKKFLGYSIHSLAEVVTCINKTNKRKYINPDQFDELYNTAYKLMNMMIAFRNSIK